MAEDEKSEIDRDGRNPLEVPMEPVVAEVEPGKFVTVKNLKQALGVANTMLEEIVREAPFLKPFLKFLDEHNANLDTIERSDLTSDEKEMIKKALWKALFGKIYSAENIEILAEGFGIKSK